LSLIAGRAPCSSAMGVPAGGRSPQSLVRNGTHIEWGQATVAQTDRTTWLLLGASAVDTLQRGATAVGQLLKKVGLGGLAKAHRRSVIRAK
jgi:hypothetical protein